MINRPGVAGAVEVRCHMSGVRCQASGVKCHGSFNFFNLFFTKWRNWLVEGLLTTGPNPSSLFKGSNVL